MTQTSGDLWARLRRPLLEPDTRFAWAAPVFRDLRLALEGREQALEGLFARVLYNDVERETLCVGFGESAVDRSACAMIVRVERGPGGVRLEVSLGGRLPKELSLGERVIASHPGAGDAPAGAVQGPFPAVVVFHL
jgi:hypothetical protein